MMREVLTTSRLTLRLFTLADAPRVRELAGHITVARTTLNVPHPYEEGMAETWINSLAADRALGKQFAYAVCDRATGDLLGACGLVVNAPHGVAELGYWLGFPYWGQGYMTEAARVLVREGFDALSLRRVYARHFDSNPASGRVMAKLGMQREGVLRQHITKWDVPLDLVYWGVLREEFVPEF